MGTGNSASMTMNGGKPSPDVPDQTDCEELAGRNEQERSGLVQRLEKKKKKRGLTMAEQDVLDKAKGPGMTFSSAKVSVGAPGGKRIEGVATGCSNGKAAECTPNGLVSGGSGDVKTGQEGMMCEPTYTHPPPAGDCPGAHAEAKVLNQMSEMAKSGLGGGSITLKIDWRYSLPSQPGKTFGSGMPCRHCFRMLCHAATVCKIEIYVCDSNNEPQKLQDHCDKKSGKATEDPYVAFDKKIDGWTDRAKFSQGQGAF